MQSKSTLAYLAMAVLLQLHALHWCRAMAEVDLETCHVPPYSISLHEVNVTAESELLLLTEGKCYLACLRDGGHHQNYRRIENQVYPAWPFPIINADCGRPQQIHECTRGCRIHRSTRNLSTSQCTFACRDECKVECNGGNTCSNQDTIELWVAQSGCSITCSRSPCETGCVSGEHVATSSQPPQPLAPPTLTPLDDLPEESLRAGVYSVNLTLSMPMPNEADTFLYGFLFRIVDILSANITYIWQHDPRDNLSLTSHACRSVNVSFAVVNSNGPSAFTDAVALSVYGGSAVNLTIIPSKSLSVLLGDYISLNCSSTPPADVDITYTWTHLNTSTDLEETSSILTFPRISLKELGTYHCSAPAVSLTGAEVTITSARPLIKTGSYPARITSGSCPSPQLRDDILVDVLQLLSAQFGEHPLGLTMSYAAESCDQVAEVNPGSPPGMYWIYSDGNPVQVLCQF